MTMDIELISIVLALFAAIVGFGLGRAYFTAVRLTANMFAAGDRTGLPIALTAGRFVAALLIFGTVAILGGAVHLLAAFAGFLVARFVALRAAQRER